MRNPLRKSVAFDVSFRTCIMELRQAWFMPLSLKKMPPPVLQSCCYQAHLDFLLPQHSGFPEATLANLMALLIIMHCQEQRAEFFLTVCDLYKPPNISAKLLEVCQNCLHHLRIPFIQTLNP